MFILKLLIVKYWSFIPAWFYRIDSAIYLSGLGTVALEIYEQVPKLDAVIFPAGTHCGLLASSAAVLKHLNPQISVIVSIYRI